MSWSDDADSKTCLLIRILEFQDVYFFRIMFCILLCAYCPCYLFHNTDLSRFFHIHVSV